MQNTEEMPERIGRYEVTAILGEGSFSTIYEANDPAIGRPVALKVMRDPKFASRLRAEGNTLGRMSGHPYILNVHDSGTDNSGENGSLDYLVLERCDGSFRNLINNREQRSWRDYVHRTVELLEGLQALHDKEIVHRDLKPENILLNKGSVRIGDFGLVTDEEASQFQESIMQSMLQEENTGRNLIMGSLQYMAPEQKRQKNTVHTTETNTYSVGQILNELLTGRRADEMGKKDSVTDFGAHKWLDEILDKARAFEPEKRYQTAREFATDLRMGLAGEFDNPTTSERAWQLTKKTASGLWTASKFTGKWGTLPLWGPGWLIKWGAENDDPSILLGLGIYTAASIYGVVQVEKHFEHKTKADAQQVFAQQPDSMHLVYRNGQKIKIARLNTLLTDKQAVKTVTEKAGQIIGAKEGNLYFLRDGEFSEEEPTSYMEQVFRVSLTTGKLEGMIDYSNPENDWIRRKRINGRRYFSHIAEDPSGRKAVRIETYPAGDTGYILDEKGNVLKDNGKNWCQVGEGKTIIPGTDLIFDHNDHVQVSHEDDWWGDLELFKGRDPFLVVKPQK